MKLTPTMADKALMTAVEEAVAANWTVGRFRREAAKAWDQAMLDKRADAAKEWEK
jgi:hypothetical protein